jgi:hypothetical protein
MQLILQHAKSKKMRPFPSQPFSFTAIISSLIPYCKDRLRLLSLMEMTAALLGAVPTPASALSRDSREAFQKNKLQALVTDSEGFGLTAAAIALGLQKISKATSYDRRNRVSSSGKNRQLHRKQTSYRRFFSFFSHFFYMLRSQTPSANV